MTTPEPWTVSGCTVTTSRGTKIRLISPRGAAPEAWSKIREEMECDARLVAEAPTMLRKLREITRRGYLDQEVLQVIEFIEKGRVTKQQDNNEKDTTTDTGTTDTNR